ncbi:MAG: SpoIIE family protein phosphatase [Planctomycetia bacterium]|nr:SpoIIE family protein phosphatase [Planctomycetia bacterium]
MSIRAKLLLFILCSMGTLEASYLIYAHSTGVMFKQECVENVAQTVMSRSESVNKSVAGLELNVISFANAWQAYFQQGTHSEKMAELLAVGNFLPQEIAVGGGIWFEPYQFLPEKRLFSIYAQKKSNDPQLTINPFFSSEEYNYPEQPWYTQIRDELREHPEKRTCWSHTFYDRPGSGVWIKVVGAGIYNEKRELCGMATINWRVSRAVRLLSGLQFTENTIVTLIDTDGKSVLVNTPKQQDRIDINEHELPSVSSLSWYNAITAPQKDTVSTGYFRLNGVEYIFFGRELDNGMQLFVQIPIREMNQFLNDRLFWFTLMGLTITLLVIVFSLYYVTKHISRPLTRLVEEMAYLGEGNLDSMLVEGSQDEMGQLVAMYNQTTANLKDYIDAIRREATEQAKVANQSDVSRGMRRYSLPKAGPFFSEPGKFELYGVLKTGTQQGGDLFDYWVQDNQLFFAICDISDLSLDASTIIMIARYRSRKLAEAGKTPGEILNTINRNESAINESSLGIKIFLGSIDLSTGRFLFCGTGHMPPLIKRGPLGEYMWLPPSNQKVPFCLNPEMTFRQLEMTLLPGQEIFLYTDGLTESLDADKVPYHAARLKQTLDIMPKNLSLDKEANYVLRDQQQYTGLSEPVDDTSVLIVRFRP